MQVTNCQWKCICQLSAMGIGWQIKWHRIGNAAKRAQIFRRYPYGGLDFKSKGQAHFRAMSRKRDAR